MDFHQYLQNKTKLQKKPQKTNKNQPTPLIRKTKTKNPPLNDYPE